jgi:hypothetical protein
MLILTYVEVYKNVLNLFEAKLLWVFPDNSYLEKTVVKLLL